MKTLEKTLGAKPPEVKFFHVAPLTIAGNKVTALRHGMAGQPGFELVGPYAQGDAVRDAIVKAGEEFGLRLVGGRAYSSNTLESGWIPSPVPAVYTGEKTKAYRQWLPVTSYEANAGLGGSFVSDKIEDYYTTPWELGYAGFTKYDHDFIGKEALQAKEGKVHRKKVTFAWNNDDVGRVLMSMFAPAGENYKVIDLPLSNYASSSFDKVMSGGKMVGASMFSGYTWNERKMLSLGFVEEQYAKPGTELTLVWGEENGGTRKTTVERHKQTEIRVVVGPTPYAQQARETYHASGWRSKG
jgi:vanillate/3-O-methylgallate O-demethylase